VKGAFHESTSEAIVRDDDSDVVDRRELHVNSRRSKDDQRGNDHGHNAASKLNGNRDR
jgi:hypothetical protein